MKHTSHNELYRTAIQLSCSVVDSCEIYGFSVALRERPTQKRVRLVLHTDTLTHAHTHNTAARPTNKINTQQPVKHHGKRHENIIALLCGHDLIARTAEMGLSGCHLSCPPPCPHSKFWTSRPMHSLLAHKVGPPKMCWCCAAMFSQPMLLWDCSSHLMFDLAMKTGSTHN